VPNEQNLTTADCFSAILPTGFIRTCYTGYITDEKLKLGNWKFEFVTCITHPDK